MEEEVEESQPAPPKPTVQQILNCSFHNWYPKYKHITPRARILPLPAEFLAYLRADGIVLPPDVSTGSSRPARPAHYDSEGPTIFDDDDVQSARRVNGTSHSHPQQNGESNHDKDDGDEDDEEEDTTNFTAWSPTHTSISQAITQLDGRVLPKLNWSAPKDATWINPTNSMDCYTPNDIYLLLKSSDFITFDLEHCFDGCSDVENSPKKDDIPYHLCLRKHFPTLTPSTEFRCFVAHRRLIAISPRSLRYYPFLGELKDKITDLLEEFFEVYLRDSFEDESFAFDVWIPRGFERVWLIDVNPWAERTDTILFSWGEIGELAKRVEGEGARGVNGTNGHGNGMVEGQDFVRVYLRRPETNGESERSGHEARLAEILEQVDNEEDEEEEEELPVFRLVNKDDTEAHNMSAQQPYSAHKLPREFVDASQAGPAAMADFAKSLREVMEGVEVQKHEESDSD